MAVQAQYPSNVLFLNRNVQEGKNPIGHDYSSQQQSHLGGAFLDQTDTVLFNHPVNVRKRGREFDVCTKPMNHPLMPMHSEVQSKLIDLTQLHTPQSNTKVVSTGLQLAFGDQKQQMQHQQRQPHHHQHHHLHHHQSQNSQSSSSMLSIFSEDLANHVKQQQDEIEHFLRKQGEELRRALAGKRQKHYHALLGAAEESAGKRLREKEAEVEKAVRRNAELEARAAQLSAEVHSWQAMAREQEATVATLQAQLQQAMIMGRGCPAQPAERDEENGGECAGGDVEDAESAYIDPDRVVVASGPSCKACRKRDATVVVLPCRHFCLCTACDAVAQACPICFSFRTSSVEVLF